jgi:hypothetical protein
MRFDPHRRPSDEHSGDAVLAFDIETVADPESEDGSFPPWPTHRPVAASFLYASVGYSHEEFQLDTLICEPGDEATFYKGIDALLAPGLTPISFNGRAFDVNVLRLGAMAANCMELPNLTRLAQAHRYGREHADLLDLVGGYGAARGHSLAQLCHRLEIPVKVSAKGSDVGDLWRQGKAEVVKRYVEEDVAATYLLWLEAYAFRHSREDLIALPLDAFARWIETQPELEHLRPFAVCRPARWARSRAVWHRAVRAREDAARRAEREQHDRQFAETPIF